MKKLHRIVDNIGCVAAWTVGLSLVGIALGIVITRGMVVVAAQKASDAVRQTPRPNCTKRACPIQEPTRKRGGLLENLFGKDEN